MSLAACQCDFFSLVSEWFLGGLSSLIFDRIRRGEGVSEGRG